MIHVRHARSTHVSGSVRAMRIRPDEGVHGVALGQRREEVEASLGRPHSVHGTRAFHHSPSVVVVDYDAPAPSN